MSMKYTILVFLAMVGLNSCLTDTPPYQQLNSKKNTGQVFIAKARENINFLDVYSIEEEEYLKADSVKFNVGLGTLGLPAEDVKITISKNEYVRDSINQIREGNGEKPFLPFPEGAYDIDLLTLMIEAGKEYSNYSTMTYYPGEFDLNENYLLALSIESASGYTVNESQKTILFGVEAVDIPEPGTDLTIMAYGIGSGNKDMNSLSADIKTYNPDLLVVREIDKNTSRSGPADLPAILADMINMPNYTFANALNYQGGEYGTAIYSKFPINKSSTTMLPTSANEKGPLATINVQINDEQQLVFAGTHLNANKSKRSTQIPVLADSMNNITELPVILAGNFNAEPIVGDSYRALIPPFDTPCSTCPPNFPANNPSTHSDFILFKPAEKFEVIEYVVGSTAVGRHLPVILKIRLLD